MCDQSGICLALLVALTERSEKLTNNGPRGSGKSGSSFSHSFEAAPPHSQLKTHPDAATRKSAETVAPDFAHIAFTILLSPRSARNPPSHFATRFPNCFEPDPKYKDMQGIHLYKMTQSAQNKHMLSTELAGPVEERKRPTCLFACLRRPLFFVLAAALVGCGFCVWQDFSSNFLRDGKSEAKPHKQAAAVGFFPFRSQRPRRESTVSK